MTKDDIILLIQNDDWMMSLLRAVRTLNLPDWYIGSGFIRSKVWDTLHGYRTRTPIPDIDVIYFDKNDFTPDEMVQDTTQAEITYENKLKNINQDVNWSVTNQARMHIYHHDLPYTSSEEGINQWIETATCVGVRLGNDNHLALSTPRGIDDLVNMVLRPTQTTPEAITLFQQKYKGKKWLERWPKLKVAT